MALAKQHQTVKMHFTIFDTDGETPLTGQSGNCTSFLAFEGRKAPESVVISEIRTFGHYYATYTPTSEGIYDLEITCPDNRIVGESYEVRNLATETWANILENNKTAGEFMRIFLSALAEKSTGGGGSELSFRNDEDFKNRIVATVDSTGNRSSIILDGTVFNVSGGITIGGASTTEEVTNDYIYSSTDGIDISGISITEAA